MLVYRRPPLFPLPLHRDTPWTCLSTHFEVLSTGDRRWRWVLAEKTDETYSLTASTLECSLTPSVRVELVQVQPYYEISQPHHRAMISDCVQIYGLNRHTYQPPRPQCRVHKYRGAATRPSSEAILRPRPIGTNLLRGGKGRAPYSACTCR